MRCGGVRPKSTALPEPDLIVDRRYGAAQIAALMKLIWRRRCFFFKVLWAFLSLSLFPSYVKVNMIAAVNRPRLEWSLSCIPISTISPLACLGFWAF